MSQVGIPGMNAINKRTISAQRNPLDKSTVVSIYPMDLDERKPTTSPSRFIVPKGNYETPSILVVEGSSWWREIDEYMPLLEITHHSTQVADSIVRDYCVGMQECNMKDQMPGLFWIPGAFSVDKIKKDFKGLLDAAKEHQKKWYLALVKSADSLWARTNGNPMAVGELMRLAARELGLEEKEWYRDIETVGMERCPACGSFGNPAFPVCQVCKAVKNTELAKERKIQFAV